MVAHSSILTWRIPWKEEPCGPQSVGLQRGQIRMKQLAHAGFSPLLGNVRKHVGDSHLMVHFLFVCVL